MRSMDRVRRTLLLLYFAGLAFSAGVAFILSGAWGPPSAAFVNAMSIGLFLGMIVWLFVALGYGYLERPRRDKSRSDTTEEAVQSRGGAGPASEPIVKTRANPTVLAAAFGGSYLVLGLLLDAVMPIGFWVSEAVIAILGVFLVFEYVRAFRVDERVESVHAKRCDRCDLECTYMPKFDSWYCPRCGSIYPGAAKTFSVS